MSSASYEPTTTMKDIENPTSYTARAQAFDCLVFLLFLFIFCVAIGVVPAVTRVLILLQPHQPKFNVNSSSLAVVNVSSDAITANWHVTLSARNPNRNTMFFDEIVAVPMLNRNKRLSSITIAAIELSRKGQVSSRAVFSDMLLQVNDCTTTNVSCGAVNLTMELHAKAKYGGWTWPIRKDLIKVVCDDLMVELPWKVTTMAFGSSNCDVDGQWRRFETKCDTLFWNYLYVVVIVVGILALSL